MILSPHSLQMLQRRLEQLEKVRDGVQAMATRARVIARDLRPRASLDQHMRLQQERAESADRRLTELAEEATEALRAIQALLDERLDDTMPGV